MTRFKVSLGIMETPSWAVGLDARGLYYEGLVDNANRLYTGQTQDLHCHFIWYYLMQGLRV